MRNLIKGTYSEKKITVASDKRFRCNDSVPFCIRSYFKFVCLSKNVNFTINKPASKWMLSICAMVCSC